MRTNQQVQVMAKDIQAKDGKDSAKKVCSWCEVGRVCSWEGVECMDDQRQILTRYPHMCAVGRLLLRTCFT